MKTNEEKITCIETENEEIILCDDVPCAARRKLNAPDKNETPAQYYKRTGCNYFTNHRPVIARRSARRSYLRLPENK